MVDINLLNGSASVKGFSDGKDTTTFLLIWITVIMTTAFTGVLIYRQVTGGDQAAIVEKATSIDSVAKKRDVSVPTVSAINSIMEDREALKETVKPKVKLSYSEMSPLEKLNYEKKYAYTLFAKLAKITPTTMNFSRISMNSFTALSGVGTIDGKGEVTKLLQSLRQDGWNLRPKPETKVQKGSDFYKLTFVTDYELQDSLLQSGILGRKDIPSKSSLENSKKRVLTLAKESGLKLSKKRLTSSRSNLKGDLKHYYFTMSGNCEYATFLSFLGRLYKSADPVRLTNVELTDDGDPIKFRLTLAITVI